MLQVLFHDSLKVKIVPPNSHRPLISNKKTGDDIER